MFWNISHEGTCLRERVVYWQKEMFAFGMCIRMSDMVKRGARTILMRSVME